MGWSAAGALAMAAALTFAAAPALACPLVRADGALLSEGALQLAWRTEPATPVQGQPFLLFLRTCPANAALLKVDARMPEHRHGMNYRPALLPLGDGRWRVEGLLWHMSGRWEWRFDVRSDSSAAVQSLRTSVVLP